MLGRIKLSGDLIKFMSLFSSVTHVTARDCIPSESRLIFIVNEGEVGKAIGKQGANIKQLEQKLKTRIRIIEHNPDCRTFIKNTVYPLKVREIQEEDGIYSIVPIDSHTRGMLIGRNAANLREYETIIKRYFPIRELKVNKVE